MNLSEFPAAGQFQIFLQDREKLTSDSLILNTVQRFQIPFLAEPLQVASPHVILMNSEQTILVDQEIQEMLRKRAIKPAHSSQKQFLSPILLVQFEKVKPEHTLCSFQHGKPFSAEEIASGELLHVQNRPKRYPFFSVAEPRVAMAHKVQMEKSDLSVYLLVLWSGTSTKNIYRTTNNSHLRQGIL